MKDQPLFPHKTFLQQNAIDIEKLPEALQKRIYGFEELEQDLSTTLDEDRERLLDRMENLSHELDEDLEEHFEDQLSNNDEQEDEVPLPVASAPAAETEHECACKHAKNDHDLPSEPTIIDEPQKTETIPSKELSDEDILAEVLASGRHKILPADLHKTGFKAPLNFRVIAVGRFYLRRGKYDTHYQILRG